MRYRVESNGGPFNGSITLQGAKNSMLNNLCLPLLTEDEVVFDNAPRITDIIKNLNFISSLGGDVAWVSENSVRIKCDRISNHLYDPMLSVATTGSKFFIPMMVARFGEFVTGASGGCNIGDRNFEAYANSLIPLGISHENNGDGSYRFFRHGHAAEEYRLPFPSFGVTVNAILAAVALRNALVISNACQEPEIDNTIDILNQMGASIARTDGDQIVIDALSQPLHGGRFRNMSDRNAAVTFACFALATDSNLEISNFDNVKMEAFYSFLNKIGATSKVQQGRLVIYPSMKKLNPTKIQAFLYPQFHSDWQALVSPVLAQVVGESHIEEHLFQSRLDHWIELEKMGARYEFDYSAKTRFSDSAPHAVKIFGSTQFQGATVTARNLRAGAAVLIAAAASKGTTIIENAQEIERGYDEIHNILSSLGLKISIID